MVVHQHQVEVGARHHLTPAGLAHRHHRHRAAAHAAEARGEKSASTGGSSALSAASAIAVRRSPAASASIRPSIVATETVKSSSRTVRRMISMTSSSSRASRRRARSRRAGSGFSSGLQQAVQCRRDDWPGGWRARARRPSTAAIRSIRPRIALEQRQQLHAGGLARQERVEPVEHGVRLRLAGERGQHARQHLAQQFARARRAQRADMPGLPAAHRGDDALGVAEAERAQRADGGVGRRIDAAEVQFQAAVGGCQQLRHQLEHLGVVRAHLAQMVQQLGGERGGVRSSP